MEKISVLTFPVEFKLTMDLWPEDDDIDELRIELFLILEDVAPVIEDLGETAADDSEQTARATFGDHFDFYFLFFAICASFRSEVNCSR